MWIAQRTTPRFYQSEPPKELGAPTAVRQELTRFVQMGLLDEERPDGENRVYYERTDSPLWAIIETAVSVLGNLGTPRPRPRPRRH
jgi:DNA-binding transcriptional regulator PaaX